MVNVDEVDEVLDRPLEEDAELVIELEELVSTVFGWYLDLRGSRVGLGLVCRASSISASRDLSSHLPLRTSKLVLDL